MSLFRYRTRGKGADSMHATNPPASLAKDARRDESNSPVGPYQRRQRIKRLARVASRPTLLLLLIAVATAIPLLLVWIRLFWGFVLDDSFIAYRYSENLATWGQLAWNFGEDPVEGFTSFAWVLTGALFESLIGVRPHIAMPRFGVACWMVLMTLVLPLLTRRITSGVSDEAGPPAALFLGAATMLTIMANPYLAFHAFHGLETPLHILVFATSAYLALLPVTRRTTLALAVATFVSVTVRPDAVVLVLPLWTLLYVYSAGAERRQCLAGFVIFAAALATYTMIKWQYFGYPLPNTFYVKQGSGFQGLSYVKDYLTGLGPLGLLLAFGAGRSGLRVLLRDKTFMLLAVPAALFCLAHVKIHAIVGYGYRFVIMTLPLFVLAGMRACVLVLPSRASSAATRDRSSWAVRAEVTTVCALVMLSLIGVFTYRMRNYYPALQKDFRALTVTPVRSGILLERAAALSPAPLLASSDVGALPYFSRLRTLDLFGLNDEHIAHEGLTHDYVVKRNPDLVVLQDLYLTNETQRSCVDSPTYPPVVINIAGESWFVDMATYDQAGHTKAPERRQNSAAKTFQVLTAPGFSRDYVYVTNWALGEMDRYYVFVRRGYSRSEDLIHLLGTDDLDPDAAGHPSPNGNRGVTRPVAEQAYSCSLSTMEQSPAGAPSTTEGQ